MELEVGDIVTINEKKFHHYNMKGKIINIKSYSHHFNIKVKWLEEDEDYPNESFYNLKDLTFVCRKSDKCKACKSRLQCITS